MEYTTFFFALVCIVVIFFGDCDAFIVNNGRKLRRPAIPFLFQQQRYRFPSSSHINSISTLQESSMNSILENIFYSGDVESVYRRNAKAFADPQFLSFLQKKLVELEKDQEEEKVMLEEIISRVQQTISLSDGLGPDSEIMYEKRLDKIVYTNPTDRRELLETMKEELTVGFITFIEAELKNSKDIDIKLALADILQTISLVKGEAVSSEVEQMNPVSIDIDTVQQTLQDSVRIGDRNEQILAGLLLSRNDVVTDIVNNLQYLDEGFLSFLQRKIRSSKDLEEREALSSLESSIQTIKQKVSELETERVLGEDHEEELSFEQVKDRIKQVQLGESVNHNNNNKNSNPNGNQNKIELQKTFAVKSTKSESFLSIIRDFQQLMTETGKSISEVVQENYALCDFEFIKMLDEEMQRGEQPSDQLQFYAEIKAAIDQTMIAEMEMAQQKVAQILSKRDPKLMEAEAIRMTRHGEVSEAVVLLLEGNIASAEQEGATAAVKMLTKVLERIREEQERTLPPEQRLLRQLLRVQSSQKRKELLYHAFKPNKKLNPETGEFEPTGPPEIPPPVFIEIVQRFIRDFGNINSLNVMTIAAALVDEAEEVATGLYGPSVTPREQQQMMFQKNTVSVWDLANFEEESLLSGQEVPWRNDQYDEKDVEDVLGERVRRIGGADSQL